MGTNCYLWRQHAEVGVSCQHLTGCGVGRQGCFYNFHMVEAHWTVRVAKFRLPVSHSSVQSQQSLRKCTRLRGKQAKFCHFIWVLGTERQVAQNFLADFIPTDICLLKLIVKTWWRYGPSPCTVSWQKTTFHDSTTAFYFKRFRVYPAVSVCKVSFKNNEKWLKAF